MRFVVDESTGSSTTERLRKLGHDALSVAEAMPQADDATILDRARSERRVLITCDKDFGELVFRSGQAHAGILLLRVRDTRPPSLADLVERVVALWSDRLIDAFTVVTEQGARVQRRDNGA